MGCSVRTVCDGARYHSFVIRRLYVHNFRCLENFELKLEVMTKPGSNGGIFFHSEPQPGALKKGYEANEKDYKVHLDGFDQSEFLKSVTGTACIRIW